MDIELIKKRFADAEIAQKRANDRFRLVENELEKVAKEEGMTPFQAADMRLMIATTRRTQADAQASIVDTHKQAAAFWAEWTGPQPKSEGK